MQAENGKDQQEGVVHPEQNNLGIGQRHRSFIFYGGVIVLGTTLLAEVPLASAGHGLASVGYSLATLVWLTLLLSGRLRPPSAGALVVAAILLRLPFLFFDPLLSEDVYRYRWDGRVSASGVSPYRYAPDAPELAHLRDDLHAPINHPEVPTIYPPLAQGMFWLWGLTGAGIWLWRLLIVVVDLSVVRLSGRRLGLIWATCPLVILEGTWSGHMEIVVAALLLTAWWSVARRRDVIGGVAAAAGIGLKITPVAALPAFVSGGRRRTRFTTTVAIGLVGPFLFFVGNGPIMRGFREYAVRWEFNGIAYEPFKWMIELWKLDTVIKDFFTALKDPLGLEAVAPFIYAHLYPAWLARCACLIPLVLLLAFALKRPTFAGRVAWSVAALLLASPTVHPWYWLAILPLAVVGAETLLLLLAIASPLSYVWYVGAAGSEALSLLLCYGLPVLSWLALKRITGSASCRDLLIHANLPETRTSK